MSVTLTCVSLSAWCLILRKKWHSVRYTPPNSECDRLSQEPQLDFYRQHMLQHMLGTPLYSICNLKSDTVLFELVDVYKQHVTTCVTDTPREWLKQFKVAQLDVFRQYELQPAWISHRQHSVSGTIHFISRLTRFPVFYSRSLCSTQQECDETIRLWIIKPDVYFVFWYMYFRLKWMKSDVFFVFTWHKGGYFRATPVVSIKYMCVQYPASTRLPVISWHTNTKSMVKWPNIWPYKMCKN